MFPPAPLPLFKEKTNNSIPEPAYDHRKIDHKSEPTKIILFTEESLFEDDAPKKLKVFIHSFLF